MVYYDISSSVVHWKWRNPWSSNLILSHFRPSDFPFTSDSHRYCSFASTLWIALFWSTKLVKKNLNSTVLSDNHEIFGAKCWSKRFGIEGHDPDFYFSLAIFFFPQDYACDVLYDLVLQHKDFVACGVGTFTLVSKNDLSDCRWQGDILSPTGMRSIHASVTLLARGMVFKDRKRIFVRGCVDLAIWES